MQVNSLAVIWSVFPCLNFAYNKFIALELIFRSCIDRGKSPTVRKKANLVQKEGDKQLLKNYRPKLLQPIRVEIFARPIFYKMFEFFILFDLISLSQSRFKPENFCVGQLLSF